MLFYHSDSLAPLFVLRVTPIVTVKMLVCGISIHMVTLSLCVSSGVSDRALLRWGKGGVEEREEEREASVIEGYSESESASEIEEEDWRGL